MKSALLYVLIAIISCTGAGFAYADATSTTPNVVCKSLGSFSSLLNGIGCPAAGTSTVSLNPSFDFNITGEGITATATVPNIDVNSSGSATITESAAFNSPVALPLASCSLIVKKIVDGGTATPSDFEIHVTQKGNDIAHSPQPGSAAGTSYSNITAGTYTVSESGGPTDYTPHFSGDCDQNGVVNLSIDQSAMCIITNVYATSTPGGGGGGGTGGGGNGGGGGTGGGGGGGGSSGGGGCNVNCGSSGGSGPVGGNGPIIGSIAPVLLAAGSMPVEPRITAPTSTSSPMSRQVPGIPNTGVNGTTSWFTLLCSALVTFAGVSYFLQPKKKIVVHEFTTLWRSS